MFPWFGLFSVSLLWNPKCHFHCLKAYLHPLSLAAPYFHLEVKALCGCSVESGESFQVSEVGEYLHNLKSFPWLRKPSWSGHLLPLWLHLLLLHLPFSFCSGHPSTFIVLKHTQHAPNSCHGIFCFVCLELCPLDIYGASLYPSGKSERPFQTAPSKM